MLLIASGLLPKTRFENTFGIVPGLLRESYGRVFKLLFANMKIIITFVIKLITTIMPTLPNEARERKIKTLVNREIFVLELNTTIVAPYTNALGAFERLYKELPKEFHHHLPSYPTVTRRLQAAGQYFNIPTPLGIYTIKRVLLLQRAA